MRKAAQHLDVVSMPLLDSPLTISFFPPSLTPPRQVEDIAPADKKRVEYVTRQIVDMLAPTNFLGTNPDALEKAIATDGESLVKGLENLVADIEAHDGEMLPTLSDPAAFTLGENIATTPGSVVFRNRMLELIQFKPTTETVYETPLLIFPPWINRYYILDLSPEKSFINWCVDQGISVFIVSWKSADASLADVIWDDYIAAQIEAVDVVRDLLSVPSVHSIGYCVAGTTLAATLAILAAKGEADKVRSATFFTAQVDFEKAGDLLNFIDDAHISAIEALAKDGVMDGRYLAATFNLLRGNDLIWCTVSKDYLMGEGYRAFDLLHWNGDVTNLPAKWHLSYLCDLYRDNKLSHSGALSALGVPIDLTKVTTPSFIQAGREDHIAPAQSVWKMHDLFTGPITFLLAGSGHIAGVVNPPSAQKYQYWTNDAPVASLDDFIAGASETKGSWWPYWLGWIKDLDAKTVPAKGARIPGKGKLKALEDAPGSYVKTR